MSLLITLHWMPANKATAFAACGIWLFKRESGRYFRRHLASIESSEQWVHVDRYGIPD